MSRDTPRPWSQYLALAEFVANNAVNVADGLQSILFSIPVTTPCTIQFSCMAGVCRAKLEVVQTMVDRMKTALEEAQANLTVAQSRAKSQVDCSRRDETFEVGDEVVLSTHNISVN